VCWCVDIIASTKVLSSVLNSDALRNFADLLYWEFSFSRMILRNINLQHVLCRKKHFCLFESIYLRSETVYTSESENIEIHQGVNIKRQNAGSLMPQRAMAATEPPLNSPRHRFTADFVCYWSTCSDSRVWCSEPLMTCVVSL
jgi:hypothetical protein